jgi:F-type H+-transporting ATPase subunit b
MAESAQSPSFDHNLHLAAEGKGMKMAKTGAEAIQVEQGGIGSENHPDPHALGLDGTGWVALAMAVFIVILLVRKVPSLIGKMLDKRIAEIANRLEEAKRLRAEAEALRDEYARKIASAEADMAAMVAHAEEEAKALIVKADADAKELVARRSKMAEDKIAAAERSAVNEIRAKAADAATKAAATLLAARLDAAADKSLVDQTIAELPRLN